MSKVVNLDSILNQSFKFMLGGEVINVNQPSIKMVRKFTSDMSKEDADVIGAQLDFACEILNNNSSSKKFSKAEVERLPTSVINTLVNTISNGIAEADNDPN